MSSALASRVWAVMQSRLIQYRIVEAAIRDSLIPWVRANARQVFEGMPPVIVVDHAYQLASLKARVLEAGITVMGMEWLTPAGLRRYLCDALDIPFEPLGRENLELILRVAARGMKSDLASSLAADPSSALKAMDELGRSGRLSCDWDPVMASDFSHLGKSLESTGYWLPVLEKACLEAAQTRSVKLGPVLVFGWGGNHFPDLRLLSSLHQLTPDLSMVVPQPRLMGGEDVDEEWIHTLEHLLSEGSEVAQDPADWNCKHESFVGSLVLEQAPLNNTVPYLLVGNGVVDQVSRVADWIQRLDLGAVSDEVQYPVGCLISGEGSSLYHLTTELQQRGITFHQEIGETLSSGGFHTFHKLLLRCFSTHSDIEEVLRLLEWLLSREEPCVTGLEYQRLRDQCLRRFRQYQRRSFSELWTQRVSEDQQDESLKALLQFARWLEPWPETVKWDEALQRWEHVASQFGFGSDYLEPVWSRLKNILAEKEIPSRYFFEYLESLLGAPGLWRHETAVNPYARIVITTQEAAVGRTWGALAFLDSQEGGWPMSAQENPFLDDDQRNEWNKKPGKETSRLLTDKSRNQMRHQQVLGLIENCSGSVLFSGNLTDGRQPEVETFPNEWAAQVLLASSNDPATALDSWEVAVAGGKKEQGIIESFKPAPFDSTHFEQMREALADSEKDSNVWKCIYEPDPKVGSPALNASRLDNMLATPAAYALQNIFRASPRGLDDFNRQEALPLGVWTHTVLADILTRQKGQTVDFPVIEESWVQSRPEEIWMNLLTQKASWMVRTCLDELKKIEGSWCVEQVEWSAGEVEFSTRHGMLPLTGRMDLVLTSDSGELLIVDFKTGKNGEIPTPGRLKSHGIGLQYLAYLLMVKNVDKKVRVVNPFGAPDRELTLDHLQDGEGHLEVLAKMVHSRVYPRRGALRDEFGFQAEVLPLTTFPVDTEILDKQWQQFISGVES